MPTNFATGSFSAHSHRSSRTHRTVRRMIAPTVGQCFDVDISREVNGWLIQIPEIDGVTHASRRVAVEVAARECIAARTGIPIGYIAVQVRD